MGTKLNIRLAARCEAAGRRENEDDFQVAEDLSVSNVGFTTDKTFSLGSKGTLLLVCDGMGGMNAGEVASAIAVKTIKNLFEPTLLTSAVLQNDDTVCAYIKHAIIKADADIKDEAAQDSAKQGMGSTAVLAWMLGSKVYVGWCGDSRAYRYNPNFGLEQLSHDHSYVQDLVDTGKLDPDLAFDHPQKNIITRSLGDPRGAARPDVKVFDLRLGDTILLCSDGLSDSLRDEEIAASMKKAGASMAACLETLWEDSRKAGWCDNVTVVLGHVVNENEMIASKPEKSNSTSLVKQQSDKTLGVLQKKVEGEKTSLVKGLIIGVAAIVVLLVLFLLFENGKNDNTKNYDELVESVVSLDDDYFNIDYQKKLTELTQKYNQIVELEHNDNKLKQKGQSKNVLKRINQIIDHAIDSGLFEDDAKNEMKKLKKQLNKQ